MLVYANEPFAGLLPFVLASAMIFAHRPLAFVIVSTRKCHSSVALRDQIFKLPVVHLTVWPIDNASPIFVYFNLYILDIVLAL